jgi:TetR/AcrR family transcriptional regulator, cholesterol catabolism regulator
MATQTRHPTSDEPPQPVRADIIAAATKVFSERGYHAASMTEIANEIGIRKPSLYHHVRKKEDLLFAIHEQLIDELAAETQQAIDEAGTAPEKLAASLRVALTFVSRRKDAVTVFLQENREIRGPRWRELVAKRDAYEHMVQDVIAQGTEEGAFMALPPAITSKAILGMANWGYTWFDPAGPLSADEVADVFAGIALRGLEVR